MGKRERERTQAEIQADRLRKGRPPKKASDKQSERVTVNLTPAEWQRLQQLAEEEGLPLAELIMRPWREKGGS